MRIERQQHLDGHASPILCSTSSTAPGAAPLVASGSEDGRICLHDIAESRLAHQLQAGSEDDAVSSLAFHPNEPNQLYAAVGSEVKVIDLRTGPGEACSHGINKDEVNQVAINAKGSHLAAADDAGDVQVLDLVSGKVFKSIQGAHSNIASCVSFRAHRPWELVTAGFDQTVARWDFSRGKCLSRARMEVEADAEGEAKLFNPPMVHCLAVPSTSARPWCQFVAAARGDGTVEVFDADAQPSSSSSSSSKGKEKPIHAQATASEGGNQGNSQVWRGPLLLTRARGGHTRPASAVCFVGDTSDTGAEGGGAANSSGASKRSSAGKGAPTHVLSGSEDRRLLVWRLPQLRQGQGSGVTEWVEGESVQGELSVQGSADQHEGAGAAVGGGSVQQGPPQLVVGEASHGRKVNCMHAIPAPSAADPRSVLAFVGDTSRRLSCYRLGL